MRGAVWNNLLNELKLNSIIDFNEKQDSIIEIFLPNGESLISINDSWLLRNENNLITFDEFNFLFDNIQSKLICLSKVHEFIIGPILPKKEEAFFYVFWPNMPLLILIWKNGLIANRLCERRFFAWKSSLRKTIFYYRKSSLQKTTFIWKSSLQETIFTCFLKKHVKVDFCKDDLRLFFF